MLRKILASIVTAVRAAFSFLGRVAAAPLRFLGGMAGSGGGSIPPAPEDGEDLESVQTPAPPDDTALYERIAALVMRWCTESVIADRHLEMPPAPAMPRSCAEWLIGLERDELIALGMATKAAVAEHIRGTALIDGVRAVQPLPKNKWPQATPLEAWDRVSPGLLSVADYADAEPVGGAIAIR
jgi:hypothetical protein